MITECKVTDIPELISLAKEIYTGSSTEELAEEFKDSLQNTQNQLLVYQRDGQIIGFVEISIRQDYVEGVNQTPCGYIEGICVDKRYRHQGVGKALVVQGEAWSRKMGCHAFASDCQLDNHESLLFHQRIGFKEVSRNIHFIK